MIEVEVDGKVIKRPDKPYQPRALKWSGIKQNNNENLSKVIDVEKNYNFKPYIFTSRDVTELQLYADLGESTILLSNDEIPKKVLTCGQ